MNANYLCYEERDLLALADLLEKLDGPASCHTCMHTYN